MKRVIELARQVAISDTTVLIRGESGTGRGVLAKSIHLWSNRAANPFATVSCPALSPQLLESELFGHVKGAFTGAVRDNPGRLAACDGGTMLLDEIGDLPMALQPNLLRSVLDREYERVGEAKTRRADVRILAATNVDLEEAVRAGRFREDLLYRIKVVQIDLPALRDRPEDIASLAERFVAELRNGKPVVGFTNDALAVSLIRVFWMRQRISRSRRYFCSCRRRPEQTSIFNSWPRWGARSKVGNCDAHSNRRTRPKKRWPLFRTSRRRPAEARLWRRDQNEGAGGYHCIKSAHAMRHPTQFRSLQWALKASFVHL
jgi:hypothetical protein